MEETDAEIQIRNLHIIIVVLLVFIICGGIMIEAQLYRMNLEIDNIEPNIINYELNPLQGWNEQCIENKTIRYNQYTNINKANTEIEITMYYDDSEYEFIEVDGYEFVKTWNETVCSKKMLVYDIIVPQITNTFVKIIK